MPAFSTIERAFQIAQSGAAFSIDDVRAQLTREGYGDALAQTSFPTVRRQLNDLMRGRPVSRPKTPARSRRTKRKALGLSFETSGGATG